jgi:radical SAM protein with 4Fe4S-binding SPASM domain
MRLFGWIKKGLYRQLLSSLTVELTQRCNNNCIFCFNVWKNDLSYPRGELGTSDLKRLFSRIFKESRIEQIALSGGEPLLRKDLLEIASFLSKMGVSIRLISNGTLFTRKLIEELVEAGIDNFELPLLSTDERLHNSLCRADSYKNVVRSIGEIKLAGAKVFIVFVAMKPNLGELREVIEMGAALGVDGMMFNRFNAGGEGAKHLEMLVPEGKQIEYGLDLAEELVEKYGINISCSIPIQPCLIDISGYKNLSFAYCSACSSSSYVIDPLGNLRICDQSPVILGNLFKKSLKKLLKSEKILYFRDLIPPFCKGCEHADYCRGGCKAAAEICYGSASLPEPFLLLNKK